MSAIEVYESLAERGISLVPDGDMLIARPSARLTDADRVAIRAHKAELLALLGPKAIDAMRRGRRDR